MRNIIKYLLIGYLFAITSCSELMGDRNLGKGYRFWNDEHIPSIVFNNNKNNQGSGFEVIPPIVISYTWNNDFIIVKNQDMRDHRYYYWVIDKRIKINLDNCHDQKSCDSLIKINVTGPLDLKTFKHFLVTEGIQLKLSDR